MNIHFGVFHVYYFLCVVSCIKLPLQLYLCNLSHPPAVVQGVKEVTLLGQNVNSYRDTSEVSFPGSVAMGETTGLSEGFRTIYKAKTGGRRFDELLDRVSQIDPDMRIRFTSPHPKDFPDGVNSCLSLLLICHLKCDYLL